MALVVVIVRRGQPWGWSGVEEEARNEVGKAREIKEWQVQRKRGGGGGGETGGGE